MTFLQIGEHSLSERDVSDLLATDHPMVESFRFRKQRETVGRSVEFALEIVPRPGVRYLQQRDARGDRVEPLWKTLEKGERIGQANRGMWMEGGAVVAENRTFFPDQRYNDLGIGSALYVALERLYRALGVKRVTLLAVDVGVYVWARQAFAFQQPGMVQELEPRLDRFLFGHGVRGVPPQPLRESWDFAGVDAPGVTVEGDRVGKAFMLGCAPPWHGERWLDIPPYDSVAETSRRETFSRLPSKIDGASADLAVR